MKQFSRRDFIGTGAAVASTAAVGGFTPIATAQTPTLAYKPEAGAKLRVLRWKRFVQGDEDQFMVSKSKSITRVGKTSALKLRYLQTLVAVQI